MKFKNNVLVLLLLIFANGIYAMEKEYSSQDLLESKENEVSSLVDYSSRKIADKLAKDLVAKRGYRWFQDGKIPQELYPNILLALCRYHSDLLWQYLSDSISVISPIDPCQDTRLRSEIKMSADGRFVTSVSPYLRTQIRNIKTDELMFPDHNIKEIDISFDGKFIAFVSEDLFFKVFATENADFLSFELADEDRLIKTIAINKESTFAVTVNESGKIKFWDLKKCGCFQEIETNSPFEKIMISPNNNFVISLNPFKIWQIKTAKCIDLSNILPNSVAISKDGNQIIFLDNLSCNIIDAQTGQSIFRKELIEESRVGTVAISSNNKKIAIGTFSNVGEIINLKKPEKKLFLNGHSREIYSIKFSSDDKLVITCSMDHKIKIWDAKTGKCLTTLFGNDENLDLALSTEFIIKLAGIISIAIGKNNDVIAAALVNGNVQIWRINFDGGLIKILEELKNNIGLQKSKRYYIGFNKIIQD